MRLSGFLELPRLAKESPSPTWQARGGRWVGFSGLSSSISCTIGTSPMGSATCVEQRGREPQENGRVYTQAPEGRQSGHGPCLCRLSRAQLALFPRICRPYGTCVDTNGARGEGQG